jgi:hypothetical protein
MSGLSSLLKDFLPPDLAEKPEAAIAFLVVAVTIVLLLLALVRGGSKGGKTVVISGPCNGGKTCLFHKLMGSKVAEGTVASMQENEGVCQVPNGGSARIVDVPGHERLRHKLDRHLRDARCVGGAGGFVSSVVHGCHSVVLPTPCRTPLHPPRALLLPSPPALPLPSPPALPLPSPPALTSCPCSPPPGPSSSSWTLWT